MTYSSDSSSGVVERFEGEWFEGKMQGKGVYYYADGSVYDGAWVTGKMQGKGAFIYPNGNKYDGDFFVRIQLYSFCFLKVSNISRVCCSERCQRRIRHPAVQERGAVRGTVARQLCQW